MNWSRKVRISLLSLSAVILGCTFLPSRAQAQDTSTSTTSNGQSTIQTEMQTGTVTYVAGNDLFVKADDGTVHHFVVSDDKTVNVDGKDLTVHDLKPGMRLTRTITTTTTPTTVTTVRNVKGKVWFVSPPSTLILQFPDYATKQYAVPSGTQFESDGKKYDISGLRKGMYISATVVTETPMTVANMTRSTTGTAPAAALVRPQTPPVVGVLLIEVPSTQRVAAAPAPSSSQEVAQNSLPKTASTVPLIGLLGLLCLTASFGMYILRPR
jgi:hypothetical protein